MCDNGTDLQWFSTTTTTTTTTTTATTYLESLADLAIMR